MPTGQIWEMYPLQRQKRTVHNQKCDRCKNREDSPLKTQCFPEHIRIAERSEPEHVHVIRQRRPTDEENADKDGKNENKAAAPATVRRLRPWPVNGLRHSFTPFSSTSLAVRIILSRLLQSCRWLPHHTSRRSIFQEVVGVLTGNTEPSPGNCGGRRRD